VISKFRGRNFFKGVECNIPSVDIGILPVKRVRGPMFMGSEYDGECLSNDNSQA